MHAHQQFEMSLTCSSFGYAADYIHLFPALWFLHYEFVLIVFTIRTRRFSSLRQVKHAQKITSIAAIDKEG